MESSEQPAARQSDELSAALDRLWIRFLPEIETRVAILESAASAALGGILTPQLKEEAKAAAHKLAGILGTFGLEAGTAPARKAEDLYSSEDVAKTEQAQMLVQLAAELRALVETRKQARPSPK